MSYRNIRGKQWFVFLASPAIYQRLHGQVPAGDTNRVVEVHTAPKNAIY